MRAFLCEYFSYVADKIRKAYTCEHLLPHLGGGGGGGEDKEAMKHNPKAHDTL